MKDRTWRQWARYRFASLPGVALGCGQLGVSCGLMALLFVRGPGIAYLAACLGIVSGSITLLTVPIPGITDKEDAEN